MVVAMTVAPRLSLTTELRAARIIAGLVIAVLCGVAVALAAAEGVWQASLGFGVLSVCGVVTAFGRKGAFIEGDTLTNWWGLWWPLYRKRRPLVACDHVLLREEVRGSGKNQRTVQAVELAVGDDVAIEIIALGDYYAARRFAERVANHFGVGLHDDTTGTLVVREAGTLDEPLRSRLFRERPELAAPSPEPPGRLVVHREGEKTSCVLPAADVHWGTSLALVVGLAIVICGTVALFVGQGETKTTAVLSLVIGIPLVVFGTLFALDAVARNRVIWSRAGITVVPWGIGRAKHIPADELEELFAVKTGAISLRNRRIAARSDRATLWIGMLSEEELDWLYDDICYGLASMAFGYRGGSELTVGDAEEPDGLEQEVPPPEAAAQDDGADAALAVSD